MVPLLYGPSGCSVLIPFVHFYVRPVQCVLMGNWDDRNC